MLVGESFKFRARSSGGLAGASWEARVGQARGAVEGRLLAPQLGMRVLRSLEQEPRDQGRGPAAPFLALRNPAGA